MHRGNGHLCRKTFRTGGTVPTGPATRRVGDEIRQDRLGRGCAREHERGSRLRYLRIEATGDRRGRGTAPSLGGSTSSAQHHNRTWSEEPLLLVDDRDARTEGRSADDGATEDRATEDRPTEDRPSGNDKADRPAAG
jgi:hypothetical protein